MGGTAKDGTHFTVDHRCWLKNGKPWIPVSGEFHYVRYPEDEWPAELAKMRSLGVEIVSTYVFWNHHENPQGKWDWSGQRNLRRFIELAREQGLLVWLRVGPYVNAEARNGGIPDFANKGKRGNDPAYLSLVDAYFTKVATQVEGLFVKDGGPIVGIQLENEFASGDPKHITKLKELVITKGMVAPYYSVTANSRFEKGTAIPLQGSYTYRGWEGGGGTKPTSGFVYGTDEWTANTDLGGTFYDTRDYPRGYCELGTGSPMRPGTTFLVEPAYVLAQAYDCVGRGANMIGYYMFHGGTQVPGLASDWPLTYDFQAPLGEFGQLRDSGREYRRLHLFLQSFAPEIAPALVSRDPQQVTDPKDTSRLRHIGRFHAGRGFWFVNNTQRNVSMPERHDVQCTIKTPEAGGFTIPSVPLTMPAGRSNVFPFRLDLGGIDLLWATVQPLARLDSPDHLPTFVFWMPDWTNRELAFPVGTRIAVESGDLKSGTTASAIIAHADGGNRVSLTIAPEGKAPVARMLLLTERESKNTAMSDVGGVKRLIITRDADVVAVAPAIIVEAAAGATARAEVYPSKGFKPLKGWTTREDKGWLECTHATQAAPAAATFKATGPGIWQITGNAVEWRNFAHAYADIRYRRGSATLLMEGVEQTNDFHHGAPWRIDLKRWSKASGKVLTLKLSDPDSLESFDWEARVALPLTGF